jgi:hypothetical protein
MSKRSRRKARNASKKKGQTSDGRQQKKDQEDVKLTSGPWLSKRTGYRTIGIISLLLAAFMAWQLWPSEGPFRSILWGLGFGAAIWGVFFLSLAFNTWIRRRNSD